MNRASRFVMTVAMACLPLLTSAEGKCADDPVPYGPGGKLVVTWSIPHPQGALAKFCGEDVFKEVDRQLGLSSIPPGYPDKYKNPKPVDLYNDTELLTAADAKAWLGRYKIPMSDDVLAAYDEHVKGKHAFRGALVEHPPVNPAGYSLCSCVLQRGVILYDPASKQEDLYVRSHFSSVKDAKTFENFAPRGGYWLSFTRDKIWFPLRLNRFLKEPGWMVLDILTPKGKPLKGANQGGYQVVKQAQVTLFGRDWDATRVLGTFQPGKAVPDLEITPP